MRDSENQIFDVIIVGAGPAGLNAALLLGRCTRKVLVFDSGSPRNFRSQGLHGFISRDGIHPLELLRIAKDELKQYPVQFVEKEIVKAVKLENKYFEVTDEDGSIYVTKKLLLATGLVDQLPQIPEIDKFYGKSVHHCPYCDGWEVRHKSVAVYGSSKTGSGLALVLTTWTDDVLLLTDGKKMSIEEEELVRSKGIEINKKKIKGLEGRAGVLHKVIFEDGSYAERDALFFSTGKYQRSNLGEQLGCKFTEKGLLYTDKFGQTTVSGVYGAGDAAKDMQLVVIAAAEGAKSAIVINKTILKEEKELRKLKQITRHA